MRLSWVDGFGGVIVTDDKFVIVLKGQMYGPFPNRREVVDRILSLLEEPNT
ncbi:hypothetical protein COHCIP112018_02377 [Cohnella sp. JJ-181]|nr:hypothetical protein COHCIP112018_02377 [Cohnella sp. JJ-181]